MLILDFDGTMTDVEREGVPFTEGFLRDLSEITGWPMSDVRARAAEIQVQISQDPGSHGWVVDGVIMAPATVDPYLRIKPVAWQILEEAGCYPDPKDRMQLLTGELYGKNYLLTETHFKDGAGELLGKLMFDQVDAYIVTNSRTKPVQDKLRKLAIALGDHYGVQYAGAFVKWWIPRVFGDAKKYLPGRMRPRVDPLRFAGLNRPVQTARPYYYRVLDMLRQRHGCTWDEVTVVGDIFELDLSLPFSLGTRVGLMANEHTPDYERAYLNSLSRGCVLDSLDEVLPFYNVS